MTGKSRIETELGGTVTIGANRGAAALEVMSRFAIDPRWLVYLPPTMSPCETSDEDGWLERPEGAFGYFASEGVEEVVCEEKHMGSRAIVVLCRDSGVAVDRFGDRERVGVIYTRTGRPFFGRDEALEREVLERVSVAMTNAGLWNDLRADWVCLDVELMPWSAKAEQLLRGQYAAVAAAGELALARVGEGLRAAQARGLEVDTLLTRASTQASNIRAFRDVYRGYSWRVSGIDDLSIAPFHLLAAGGDVWVERSHHEHLAVIDALCEADPALFRRTERRFVRLDDDASRVAATRWWEELTAGGGEGMVVKPLEFTARGPKGLVQPGLKVRGREYLRIIYGPDYTQPENLERLRQRGLGRKRALARREYALGVEALRRFVQFDTLRRVHECVFGVLALESEPVDPRL